MQGLSMNGVEQINNDFVVVVARAFPTWAWLPDTLFS